MTGREEGNKVIFEQDPLEESIKIVILNSDENGTGISITDAVVQSKIPKLNPIEKVDKIELGKRLDVLNNI